MYPLDCGGDLRCCNELEWAFVVITDCGLKLNDDIESRIVSICPYCNCWCPLFGVPVLLRWVAVSAMIEYGLKRFCLTLLDALWLPPYPDMGCMDCID